MNTDLISSSSFHSHHHKSVVATEGEAEVEKHAFPIRAKIATGHIERRG